MIRGFDRSFSFLTFAIIVALCSTSLIAAEPFQLKDQDRVVFLGATFVEREGQFGYLETALTTAWPDRQITFRNLGWSGDTVWADSRDLRSTACWLPADA